ncbi:MAG: rod shape-determining protein MreD [Melioribacteraceae bacterium]|nr:rod shape-determining protein MreD [Melioribacteraceae bacterium]
MLNKIVIPLIVASILIAIQFFIIPLIAIKYIIPNVVFVFIVLYSLRFGQVAGVLFGFSVGFLFDVASAGFIGSGMFAFTLSAFVAGYFHKEDYLEVIYNIKVFLSIILLLSTLFFLLYSILGMQSIEVEQNYNFILYSLLCGFYTTVISLAIFILPKRNL